MNKYCRFLLILIMALVFAGKSHAWHNSFENDKLKLELVPQSMQLNPQQEFDILVKFTMKNGWHILADNPGDIGRPTVLKFDLPEGYQLKNVRWSIPKRFENNQIVQFGYDNEAYYRATIVPIERPEPQIRIPLEVSWLSCREECIPGKFETTMDFEVTEWNIFPTEEFKYVANLADKTFRVNLDASGGSRSQSSSLWFVLLLALSTVFLPLITSFYGSLNISTVISGYIGLIFVIMSFCALSNLISMLSTRPVISFLAAFILIRLLMMLNLEGWQDYGFTQNYYNIISGRLALSSIMYFILMTLLSLWAEQAVISNKKTL